VHDELKPSREPDRGLDAARVFALLEAVSRRGHTIKRCKLSPADAAFPIPASNPRGLNDGARQGPLQSSCTTTASRSGFRGVPMGLKVKLPKRLGAAADPVKSLTDDGRGSSRRPRSRFRREARRPFRLHPRPARTAADRRGTMIVGRAPLCRRASATSGLRVLRCGS